MAMIEHALSDWVWPGSIGGGAAFDQLMPGVSWSTLDITRLIRTHASPHKLWHTCLQSARLKLVTGGLN